MSNRPTHTSLPGVQRYPTSDADLAAHRSAPAAQPPRHAPPPDHGHGLVQSAHGVNPMLRTFNPAEAARLRHDAGMALTLAIIGLLLPFLLLFSLFSAMRVSSQAQALGVSTTATPAIVVSLLGLVGWLIFIVIAA